MIQALTCMPRRWLPQCTPHMQALLQLPHRCSMQQNAAAQLLSAGAEPSSCLPAGSNRTDIALLRTMPTVGAATGGFPQCARSFCQLLCCLSRRPWTSERGAPRCHLAACRHVLAGFLCMTVCLPHTPLPPPRRAATWPGCALPPLASSGLRIRPRRSSSGKPDRPPTGREPAAREPAVQSVQPPGHHAASNAVESQHE